MTEGVIPRTVCIGHVHLKVSDLDRAILFYRDVLGFQLTGDGRPAGVPAAFLAAGDYHHHIGLNTFQSANGSPPPPNSTGLYHFALLYPDRRSLAVAARRVQAAGYALRGVDHGGTVSVYLNDPDGNGIELYYDRPRETWFDPAGRPVIKAEPFDVAALIADAEPGIS